MAETLNGRHGKLIKTIRDAEGKSRFMDSPFLIVRKQPSGAGIDKQIYMVQWEDGVSTYLFIDEFILID